MKLNLNHYWNYFRKIGESPASAYSHARRAVEEAYWLWNIGRSAGVSPNAVRYA